MLSLFRHTPVLILVIAVAVIALNPYMPLVLKQGLYALSLSIKSGIIFVLPIIIFSLIFKMVTNLSSKATLIIGMLLLTICCSNFLTAFLSHFAGEWLYQFNLSTIPPGDSISLTPAWTLTLPVLIDNNKVLLIAVLSGLLCGRLPFINSNRMAETLDQLTSRILYVFKFVIPLFIAGFMVKLQHDGMMLFIVQHYLTAFLMIALALLTYISFVYAMLNRFQFKATLLALKNMLPAAIAGFSTMSSAAVMPLTIEGVRKNTQNKALASSIIPFSVNIHLMGDCIAIPLLAYTIMKGFGMPIPSLTMYLIFLIYFVIAKFSVAAVPGGGIIVMLPILETYLGFTPEMLSLITALYILFDPVITCANVLGNGALAKFIDNTQTASRRLADNSLDEATPPFNISSE